MQDELLFLYHELRQQLEVAYADLERNRARIDLIALDLMSLERSLALENVLAPQLAGLRPAASMREWLRDVPI